VSDTRTRLTELNGDPEGPGIDAPAGPARSLDQIDRKLDEAETRAETLERELHGTIDELSQVGSRTVAIDPEALATLFGELSKQCHKINNPLTSIMGRAQMMEMKLKRGSDEQLVKSVTVIQESAKRVAGLIQELANLVCQARKEYVETYDSNSGSR
jgi:signal transduction histidine kinase